ncbi:MAG: T9SS C-terminal target domain-containing protein [Cryomorphaceae bacterium]|nr:MAG: T9SS C-terminal target domain-containing protein [Cryomorphaceae bacterium]
MALDNDGDIVVSGQCEINDSTTTYYTVKYVEMNVVNPYSTLTSLSSKHIKPNNGQLITTDFSEASDVLFINDCDYPKNYVLSDRISYVFRNSDESVYQFLLDGTSDTTMSINATDTLVRVDMKPKNPSQSRKIVPFNQKRYYESYFLSHFDEKRIHSYEQVVVFGLWRDIDMHITNEEPGMGISLVCKPQFKPDDIAWYYEGADSVEIVTPHSIIVHTQTGKFGYEANFAREVSTNGTHNQLSWKPEFSMSGNYVVLGLSSYDVSKPLILSLSKSNTYSTSSSSNGNLEWSTFYGGSDSEQFNVVATDGMGNAFIGGETQSDNFPVTPGVVQFEYELNLDACIVKFDHETLNNEWATFYGGTGVDRINGLAITSDDEIIMCGFTSSSDFPVENELQPYVGSSGFVGKLNSTGSIREWATPFGPFSFNTFTSVAVDNENNIYCVGYWIGQINGLNIQIYPQTGTDSYTNKAGSILKLSSSGTPLWSTTFGHRAYCRLTDIAIDQNNNKYITGATRFEPENPEHTEPTIGVNPNFISNAQSVFSDGFIAKFGSDDNLAWSSWYCGNNLDQGEGIAVNNDGSKVCIVGATTSVSGLPLLNALPNNSSYGGDDGQTPIGSTDHHGDGFIAEFSENGTFLFGSYLGGSNNDACLAVAYDWADQIYITGYTLSTNVQWLTNTTGGITGLFSQSTNQGLADAFIVALNPSRNLVWGSFFGGASFDYGYGLATTSSEKLFLVGRTFSFGGPASQPFPLSNYTPSANPYFQNQLNLINEYEGEKSDGFVSRFSLLPLAAVVRVREIEGSAQLKVYPNPNNGQFMIDLELLNTAPGQLSIYSIDGRLVFQRQLGHSSQNHIDTSGLPSGTYILSLQHEENRYFAKFIKL